MKHKTSGGRILAVVLLVAALCFGPIPAIGNKNIVRAMLVSHAGGEWTVGLICMQPGQAADSADAEEEMSSSWGSAAGLAEAFAEAESGLSGKAIYKLCDIAAIDGDAPMQTLHALSDYVSGSGSGRLAARVLYSAAPIADFENPDLDISTLYTGLEDAQADAPRLYQAAGKSLLAPCVQFQEDDSLSEEGAACLTDTGAAHLTKAEAQAAWLLQNSFRTLHLIEADCPLTIQSITGVAVEQNGEKIVVRGLVRGLPTEKEARAALLRQTEENLQQQLREAQSTLEHAGVDAAHANAFITQACGVKAAKGRQTEWDIRLWAE
jgi:hypothetical protein